jgi:hypothetical protein
MTSFLPVDYGGGNMAIIVGTNSWVTIAEANDYIFWRYGASAWATLSDADKEALLRTAYNLLRMQSGYTISPTSTAQEVKNAQCETAWFWYQHGEEWDKRSALYAGGVRSFSVMSWSESLAAPDLPPFIKNMIKDFYTSGNYKPTVSRSY